MLQYPEEEAQEELEEKFWESREILSHIFEFARSRRQAPWSVFGASLIRAVASAPPNIVLPATIGGHGSLNLFLSLVGRAGTGKGGALAVSKDAISLLRKEINEIKLGSGEGIPAAFVNWEPDPAVKGRKVLVQHAEKVIFYVPEIDSIAAVASRGGATLMSELRAGWSGEALGFNHRSQEARLPVNAHTYRLCLVVGVQPEKAQALLSPSEVDGGTPQRFLWVSVLDPHAPDNPPDSPAQQIVVLPDETLLPADTQGRRVIPICEEARLEIDTQWLHTQKGLVDPLDGHLLFCQLKVAAGLSFLDNREEWGVTLEDWKLAKVVIAHSNLVRTKVQKSLQLVQASITRAKADTELAIEDRKADKVRDRLSKWILKKLPLRTVDLRRSAAGRDKPFLAAAIQQLLDEGAIELKGESYYIRGKASGQ